MKNKTPILVLTGLAILAAAGIAALTRDQWMGQPATQLASQEQAPATTAEKPAAEPEATGSQQATAEQPAPQQTTPEQPADKPAEQQQATAEQPAAEQPAQATPAAQPEAQPQPNAADAAKVPAFDTVRVEKTGEAVIAGRAEAGSEVTVKFGGQDIGKTTANADGAFVLVPEKPLPAGSGALTIEAKGKGDLNPVASQQSVAVIVPAGQQAEALVALVSPDQPTKVLQKPSAPAAEKPAEKPAETAAAEQPAAEQPAAQPEAEQKPAKLVSIDAVDYDATGNIVFSGQGEAGNTARIYVDNNFVGDAAVGADGRWTFAGTADVSKGVHTLRVDGLDAKGNVLNRVEVPFFREDQAKVAEAAPPATPAAEQPAPQQPAAEQPAPAQPQVMADATPAQQPAEPPAAAQPEAPAAQQPAAGQPAAEQPAAEQPAAAEPAGSQTTAAEAPAADQKPAEQPAASSPPAETAAPAQPQETTQPQEAAQPPETAQTTPDSMTATAPEAGAAATPKYGRIVIQPGNNLWRISRVLYGSGTKYTVLYEANKDQIRNPNLIYPGQVFKTPDVAPKAESIDPHRHEPLKPDENAAGAN